MRSLVRIDPFRDIRTIQNRFDRLLGEAMAQRSGDDEDEPLRASWLPSVDVHENDTAITLRAELPGLSQDDVELTLDKGRLTIQGEKRLEKEDTDGDYRRIESSYGSFYRSFPLPETVDADNIEARFEKGVLYVTLPKAEEAKPKRIALKIN
jgi:HSP20 family protein